MKTKLSLDGADAAFQSLDNLEKGLDRRAIGGILNEAAKPMEAVMKSNAPDGRMNFNMRLSSFLGQSHSGDRGGATRRDIRRKIVYDSDSTATVLVGVNRNKGHVGWRAHFIELGTEKWAGKPFIERSGLQTQSQVIERFKDGVEAKVNEIDRKAGPFR